METWTTAHFSLRCLCPIHALSPSTRGDSADDPGSQGPGWRHAKGGLCSGLIQQSTRCWLLSGIDYFHILLRKPEYVWEVWQKNNRFFISPLKGQWAFFVCAATVHFEAHLLAELKIYNKTCISWSRVWLPDHSSVAMSLLGAFCCTVLHLWPFPWSLFLCHIFCLQLNKAVYIASF